MGRNRRFAIGLAVLVVVAVLGEPTRTDYFKEFDFVYWLGPERGLISVDSEWLVIKLDPSGRVSQAQVVTD